MDIQTLIDEYAAWLRSEITFQQVGEYYEITAPYLDSANDYLQIYVRQEGDEILFSDDGMTIRNLEMNGFQFTPMRTKYLKRILMQYGGQSAAQRFCAEKALIYSGYATGR